MSEQPVLPWSSRLEGLHGPIVPATCNRYHQYTVLCFGHSHGLDKLRIKWILVVLKYERLHCLFFSGIKTPHMWSGLYKGVLCNNYGCLGECCAGMCYIISTAVSGHVEWI